MARQRHSGTTILEVLVALVILTVVVIPILDTFSTFRRGFAKMSRYNIALGLASSVLEHIHFTLYNEDIRLTDMLAPDNERVTRAADEGAQQIFDEFIEADTKVTSVDPSTVSSYFVRFNDLTKTGVFGITPENDPELYRQLKDYRCSVDVYYSLPYDSLDSDVDGTPEVDMAEIKVTITWKDGERDRSIDLWTVYSARQYNDAQ